MKCPPTLLPLALLLLAAGVASAQAPDALWMRGGQAGGSNDAAWAPDGQTFAIAGQDGTIKIFDGETNLLRTTITAHDLSAADVIYSPDGSHLASHGDDNVLRVWDASTEAMVWEVSLGSWVRGMAYSPDGALLAHSHDSTVQVRDAETGGLVQTLTHVGDVGDVRFSPDGQRLVAAGGDETEFIRSWNVSGWTLERTYATTHEWADFAFTPDGTMMATSGGFDFPSIRLWNPETGALLRTISMGGSFGPAYHVGFTADAQYVYAAHRYNHVKVFRVDTGALVNHVQGTVSIHVAPDEQAFLSQPLTCGEPFQRWATFSFPDGQLLEEFMTHTSPVLALDVAPDGRTVASGAYYFDSAVRFWDAASSERTGELYYTCNNAGVTDLAYSPDGALIAAGGGDWEPQVRVWRVADGALILGYPHSTQHTEGLAFSPDGAVLVSGSSDGTVLAVTVPGGAGLYLTTTGLVEDLAYSPDGSLVAVGTRSSGIRFLDAGSGEIVRTISGAHADGVRRVDFSADGTQLVTGGGDGDVKVWNVSDGTLVRTLTGTSSPVYALDLSADDRFLLTADAASLRLWDFATGTVRRTYTDEAAGVSDVRFLPDASAFAYGRFDATVVLAQNPETTAPVAVSAEPVDPPVVIPAGGGRFRFTVTLTNTTAEPQTVQAWSEVAGPLDRSPVLGPKTVTLPPGAAVTRALTQRVPGAAPAGTYTYAVHVGTFGGTVAASDAFPLTKEAGALARGESAPSSGDWAMSGAERWDEATASASAVLPDGFALSEARPNPSSGRVTLTLEVAAAQHIRAEVYDGLGRRVAVLLDGAVEAGAHALVLDGASLPDGVYVVRAVGEAGADARRLTLVR